MTQLLIHPHGNLYIVGNNVIRIERGPGLYAAEDAICVDVTIPHLGNPA